MYQALAYCVAHDLPRCWLVYAAGNETPQTHALRHLNATVHVATVDLQGDIDKLHNHVQGLADRFADPA